MEQAELDGLLATGQEKPAAVLTEGGAAHGRACAAVFAEVDLLECAFERTIVMDAPESGETVVSRGEEQRAVRTGDDVIDGAGVCGVEHDAVLDVVRLHLHEADFAMGGAIDEAHAGDHARACDPRAAGGEGAPAFAAFVKSDGRPAIGGGDPASAVWLGGDAEGGGFLVPHAGPSAGKLARGSRRCRGRSVFAPTEVQTPESVDAACQNLVLIGIFVIGVWQQRNAEQAFLEPHDLPTGGYGGSGGGGLEPRSGNVLNRTEAEFLEFLQRGLREPVTVNGGVCEHGGNHPGEFGLAGLDFIEP